MTEGELTKDSEGLYRVSAPIGGMHPDEVTLCDGDTVYTFSGFAGTASTSKVHPDVLLYEDVTVEQVAQ